MKWWEWLATPLPLYVVANERVNHLFNQLSPMNSAPWETEMRPNFTVTRNENRGKSGPQFNHSNVLISDGL